MLCVLIDWLIFINCVTNVHAKQFQDTQYTEQLNTYMKKYTKYTSIILSIVSLIASEQHDAKALTYLQLSIWVCRVFVDAVSVSSPAEQRLLSKLMKSPHYNLLTIPVSDVSESVHVKLGIILNKIIQMVRNLQQGYFVMILKFDGGIDHVTPEWVSE